MTPSISVKRTTAADPDFHSLVALLDRELWFELNEDQATYDQYNKVPHIKTAVVVYADGAPVACGCFKRFDDCTAEVKRMFVTKGFRGLGLSKKLLAELERWACEEGYRYAVLETSVHFKTARKLYQSNGYDVIPNYAQYAGLEESVCMKKTLPAADRDPAADAQP